MATAETGSALPLFLELAELPSPSGDERAVADRVLAELRGLGLDPLEDASGAETGSTSGNLVARLSPTAPGTPIFLCAHLDTVVPTGPIVPIVEEGVVRNGAGTILGADNKAAIAVMVEAVRQVLGEGRAHAGIELVFTTREETGCQGARAFDVEALAADVGFVYDHAGPIGEVVAAAPYQRRLDVVFSGRSAHAGINPEEGRSAIVAAARAIGDLRLGRLDEETTANVGTIAGGTARNVVPARCELLVDARSRNERKLLGLVEEMLETFAFAATLSECEVETEVVELYRGYRLGRGDLPVRLALAALAACGFEPRTVEVGGGADANIFNELGLPCVVLANGMAHIHSPEEEIALADLDAMVGVTLALVDAALEA